MLGQPLSHPSPFCPHSPPPTARKVGWACTRDLAHLPSLVLALAISYPIFPETWCAFVMCSHPSLAPGRSGLTCPSATWDVAFSLNSNTYQSPHQVFLQPSGPGTFWLLFLFIFLCKVCSFQVVSPPVTSSFQQHTSPITCCCSWGSHVCNGFVFNFLSALLAFSPSANLSFLWTLFYLCIFKYTKKFLKLFSVFWVISSFKCFLHQLFNCTYFLFSTPSFSVWVRVPCWLLIIAHL